MIWRVEFSSEKFLPTLPEACQANPGAYGFELALWLAQGLCRQGIVTGYPNGEDWGWCLEYDPADGLSFMIGCCSQCHAGAGYLGCAVGWSVFIRERRTLERRIRNVSNQAELEALGGRIVDLLRTEQIEAAPVAG
ncbi:hypothetical protein [Massilia sp. 9096]|uniref:hypothetical protein n=1 Tax=Massilia sp. 9096 TaxID=1500894 RepID=UPI000B07DA88|nr:hypothetical protein [Massilia sp. 9096]